MTKPRPKTGEKRKTRQPFKIDKLPKEVHEKILDLRVKEGMTWERIEEESHDFVAWNEMKPDLLEAYPDLKLPATSLHRWYNVRIEQVQAETLKEAAVYEKFASKLATRGVEGADAAVVNAFRNEVFAMARSAAVSDRVLFMKGLNQLTLVMTRMERMSLAKKRVEAEIAKSETERAKIAAQSGDPREVYMQAVVDLLKKLRTRESVRAVLDPIKDELVQEMSYGAEAFAKQIEASAA